VITNVIKQQSDKTLEGLEGEYLPSKYEINNEC